MDVGNGRWKKGKWKSRAECVCACVCGMQIDGAAKGLRSISLRSLRMWRCKVCYTLSFNGQLPLYVAVVGARCDGNLNGAGATLFYSLTWPLVEAEV